MQSKFFARLSITLLTSFLISACSSGATNKLETYRLNDQTGHFSLDYPKGWYIGDKDTMVMGNLYYVNFSPEAKNSLNGLLVSFQDATKISQDDFVSLFKKDLEHRANSCTGTQPTSKNGAVFQLTCDGYIVVFFNGENKRYGLSYPVANPRTKDTHDFENAIESFRTQ